MDASSVNKEVTEQVAGKECIVCHEDSDRLLKFIDCLCTPPLSARNSPKIKYPTIRVHEECLKKWHETYSTCIVCRHPLSRSPGTFVRKDVSPEALRWIDVVTCDDDDDMSPISPKIAGIPDDAELYMAEVVDYNDINASITEPLITGEPEQPLTETVITVEPGDERGSPIRSEGRHFDYFCCMPLCPT